MYAVIQIGNKQYRIFENQVIHIERIHVNIGDQVKFDKVLFIKNNDGIYVGTPFIKNGSVIAKVLTQGLGKKIEIIKFKRRKHFCKSQGHRQYFTEIKIVSINI